MSFDDLGQSQKRFVTLDQKLSDALYNIIPQDNPLKAKIVAWTENVLNEDNRLCPAAKSES